LAPNAWCCLEAKQVAPGRWEAYTDNGREPTGLDVVEWARQGVELGAGEILLTSIDNEGTRHGFETTLIRAVATAVQVPVIASGGMGKPVDAVTAVKSGCADAVAMADILHYNRATLADIRGAMTAASLEVRTP